jgi:hypothetical protein
VDVGPPPGREVRLHLSPLLALPGVTDQSSLASLGRRFGVIDPSPSVTDRLSGGTERLAVLSLSVTEELLSQPEESDIISDAEEPE